MKENWFGLAVPDRHRAALVLGSVSLGSNRQECHDRHGQGRRRRAGAIHCAKRGAALLWALGSRHAGRFAAWVDLRAICPPRCSLWYTLIVVASAYGVLSRFPRRCSRRCEPILTGSSSLEIWPLRVWCLWVSVSADADAGRPPRSNLGVG